MTWLFSLLGFFKNPKILIGVAVAAVLVIGSWYVVSTIEEKGKLQQELDTVQEELSSTKSALEENKEKFTQAIKNYDEMINDYNKSIKESTRKNQELEQSLDTLKQENEAMNECLDMQLPTDIVDQIFDRGMPK